MTRTLTNRAIDPKVFGPWLQMVVLEETLVNWGPDALIITKNGEQIITATFTSDNITVESDNDSYLDHFETMVESYNDRGIKTVKDLQDHDRLNEYEYWRSDDITTKQEGFLEKRGYNIEGFTKGTAADLIARIRKLEVQTGKMVRVGNKPLLKIPKNFKTETGKELTYYPKKRLTDKQKMLLDRQRDIIYNGIPAAELKPILKAGEKVETQEQYFEIFKKLSTIYWPEVNRYRKEQRSQG